MKTSSNFELTAIIIVIVALIIGAFIVLHPVKKVTPKTVVQPPVITPKVPIQRPLRITPCNPDDCKG